MARIVHIVGGSLKSGAGRGALWLHEGLSEFGHESTFLGRLNPKNYPELKVDGHSVFELAKVGLPAMALHQGRQLRHARELRIFKPTGHGFHVHKSEFFRTADLVHIHWTTGVTFSRASWARLSTETRPIIWTLRDMWPFTGGCHVTGDCTKFTQGCGNCPLLAKTPGETGTAKEVELKRISVPRQIRFVANSNWLKHQAEQSTVLRGRTIDVIHNAVPTEKFSGIDKAEARSALGLPQDAFIAAAGALGFASAHKGPHILKSVIQKVPLNEKFHLALFGTETNAIAGYGTPFCHHLGRISDDGKLNQVYAAADVFLMPSLQESFGKATVEAMASQTPVIAFAGTAAEEIVIHGETGWLAAFGDSASFARQLRVAMKAPDHVRMQMHKASRARAIAEFSTQEMARRYNELYQSLLEPNDSLLQ